MDRNLKKRLQAFLNVIVAEANANEDFAQKLSNALETGDFPADKLKSESNTKRSANRRDPAVLDPVQMVMDGDSSLPQRLDELTEKELKDIIADYGMDPSKLAMRWKNKEKLVELILDTATRRASKGDAFRD